MTIDRLSHSQQPAILALADGSLFLGLAVGASGQTVGEVVFNTAMIGYQEILSDPSYAEQLVTLTYPHIGNVGVNPFDQESNKAWVKGLIVREFSPIASNWRSQQTLADYLKQHNIIAIADIDTRRLTRILRTKGAQHGCIIAGPAASLAGATERAIDLAKAYPGLAGMDLAKVVSTDKVQSWTTPTYALSGSSQAIEQNHHVVVYDFGVKQQILRLLVDRGCRVTVVPAQTPAEQVLALNPGGILLSNGPGDPAACDYAIQAIAHFLEQSIPIYGICLGFQLLALACGAQTLKMKFGHHGANHPVQDLTTNRVFITSQNHSFCVDDTCLPSCLTVTHRSLFDGTLQGFKHRTKPAFAFQGHPEGSPGPHDIYNLFDQFVKSMSLPSNSTMMA